MDIEVVYDEHAVDCRVGAIAKAIAEKQYHNLVIIMMLRGGVMFGVDLSRALWIKGVSIEIDYMSISCNDDDGTRHEPKFLLAPQVNVRGRDVLVVDDSCCSGETFSVARGNLRKKGAGR